MTLPIIISNRFIKILGAITKGFAYIFHFIFPKMRFTIPKNSQPILKSSKHTNIPKNNLFLCFCMNLGSADVVFFVAALDLAPPPPDKVEPLVVVTPDESVVVVVIEFGVI